MDEWLKRTVLPYHSEDEHYEEYKAWHDRQCPMILPEQLDAEEARELEEEDMEDE